MATMPGRQTQPGHGGRAPSDDAPGGVPVPVTASARSRAPLTPLRALELQRAHGNKNVTRYLSRNGTAVQVTPRKMFEDDVAAGKWNKAAQSLENLDPSTQTAAVAFLDVNQLGYLEDAARRRGMKSSGKARKAITSAIQGSSVDKDHSKPGRRYGKIWGKVGKIQHGTKANGGEYEYPIDIYFQPDTSVVAADEIAFVQTARTVDTTTGVDPSPNHPNRNTADYNHIDRVKNKKFGWYGYMDDESASGNVTPWLSSAPNAPAWMFDGPSWNRANMTWLYETAAVCRKGAPDTAARKGDKPGFVYAVITWGFKVDDKGRVKPLPTEVWNKPTEGFKESLSLWNQQAQGPAGQRNTPGGTQDLLPSVI